MLNKTPETMLTKEKRTIAESDVAHSKERAVTSAHGPAGPMRFRRRHWGVVLSFGLSVLVPAVVSAWYLFFVAVDQYASRVGFSVRNEESGSAIELLGGITELSGSSSNDTDILFEFIRSPAIVQSVSEQIDFVATYTRTGDPVFSLSKDTRIEALLGYWQRMVDVYYDRPSGLIEVRVKAFTPEDALRITQIILAESTLRINAMSDIAREDATRYAYDALERAVDRLKSSRAAVTAFRVRNQIIDPEADIQGRLGLIHSLQSQLAEAMIELNLVKLSSKDDDPRVRQGERRVAIIRDVIAKERERFSGGGAEAYSNLVSEYESLVVDQQFAQEAYVAALAAYDVANAAAQKQSRYLATYLEPTLPQTPEFPMRLTNLLLIAVASFALWSIGVMVYYSVRDRR